MKNVACEAAPSSRHFFFLQALDIITTLIGLRMGAGEASAFIGQLMHLGVVPALMICKLVAVILVLIALRHHQPRVVVMATFWFVALVTWNLLAIFAQAWKTAQA